MLSFMYNKFKLFIDGNFIDYVIIPTDSIVTRDMFIVINSYIFYGSSNGNINLAALKNKKSSQTYNIFVENNNIYITINGHKNMCPDIVSNYKPLKIIIDKKEYVTEIIRECPYISITDERFITFENGIFVNIPFGIYHGMNNALINLRVPIINSVANFDMALFKTADKDLSDLEKWYED